MKILAWPAYKNRDLNPYNTLLYEAIESQDADAKVFEFSATAAFRRRYNVFHVHWPDHVTLANAPLGKVCLRGIAFLATMTVFRVLRTHIVWTVHNDASHEQGHVIIERAFRYFFERMIDVRIFLTKASRDAFMSSRSAKPVKGRNYVIPHGHYRTVYSELNIAVAQVRQELSIDARGPVFLLLGQMRPYKNADGLVRVFRTLDCQTATLILAGRAISDEYEKRIRTEAQGDARVRLLLDFVSQENVERIFRATDIFVVPFQKISNSGSIFLALSLSTPVVVPKLEVFEELQEQVGSDWVYTYEGEFDSGTLSNVMHWYGNRSRADVCLDAFDWNRIAQLTLCAYRMGQTC